MAARGRPPKPPYLKLITGNPGKRPIAGVNAKAPVPESAVRSAPLVPHRKLNKSQHALWTRFIDTAWWLSDHDVPKAYVWCCLAAEFDRKPAQMKATRITQLRLLGSELGLDPASRARLGATRPPQDDPTGRYFE